MPTSSIETEQQTATAFGEPAILAPLVPQRRNKMLATVLVSVIVSVFIFVIGLAVLLHYAETHHALAALLG